MSNRFGVYPEAHELIEDAANHRILVRTRWYEVEHCADQGGAIAGIRLFGAGGENLLLEPTGVELGLADTPGAFQLCRRTAVTIHRRPDEIELVFECPLRNADDRDSGVVVKTAYRHRWGHVRIRQEVFFPAGGRAVRFLLLHRWVLRPELTHYAVRPGAPAEPQGYPGAFGVCQWGRFRPGVAFDTACESRSVPRYVAFAEPGRRGLEWFVGSRLAQWDYQLAGRSGVGSLCIVPRVRPPCIALRICPLDLASGDVRLKGRYEFDSIIGIPIVTGRAHPPFLHTSFNRKHWPTEQLVARWARRGIRTAHFHHDGDSFRDGLFWRDGTYPPFGPVDMKAYDRVIAACHRHGIRVATYFSNKELHPDATPYRAHGQEWARLPTDRYEQLHNHYSGNEFGAQMCLRSGWSECFRSSVDKVLSHHTLDGTYYDWNVALYCHNPRHVGGEEPADKDGLGAVAYSPAGHWDMEELLDLMEWTRRRVGPDGLMIVHNTMVPMAATENFADHVVAMEWGYTRLAGGAPELDDLPLEWNFMGARSRGVIGYGCLEPGAPKAVQRQMTLRCLLTGVAPWTASELDLTMFSPLRGFDLTRFRFFDWRSGVAQASGLAAAAAYARPEQALVLAGNLAGRAAESCCRIDPKAAGLTPSGRYLVRTGTRSRRVTAGQLRAGLRLRLPPNGAAFLVIEPG